MITILLSLVFNCSAKEVLLQGSHASSLEYEAFLKAHPDLASPLDPQFLPTASATARDELVALFAEAQRAYLSSSGDVARQMFENVMALAFTQDWRPGERQTLVQASLRRAQLGVSKEDEAHWIKMALAVDPWAVPDATLFPPPLINRWRSLKAQLPLISPAIPDHESSVILINGQVCAYGTCRQWVDTGLPVRVTWVSRIWRPQSVQLPLSRWSAPTAPRRPWLTGDCDKSAMDAAAAVFAEKRPFLGLQCEKNAPLASALNLKPLPLANTQPIPIFTDPKPSRPFYKSPWLWAGVGAVVVAIIVESQKKKNERSEDKEPSTTYGY